MQQDDDREHGDADDRRTGLLRVRRVHPVGDPAGEAGAQTVFRQSVPGRVPEGPVGVLHPGIGGVPRQFDGQQPEGAVGRRHGRADPGDLRVVLCERHRLFGPGHGDALPGQPLGLRVDALLVGGGERRLVRPGHQHGQEVGVRLRPEPLLGDLQSGRRVVLRGKEPGVAGLDGAEDERLAQDGRRQSQDHPQGDHLPGTSRRESGQGADHISSGLCGAGQGFPA